MTTEQTTPSLFRILSPDGFDFEMDAQYTMNEITPALTRFVNRFRFQGYYSTGKQERIPLDCILENCRIVPLPADSSPKFPLGLASWCETHFDIAQYFAHALNEDITKNEHKDHIPNKLLAVLNEEGTGGLYEYAQKLADEFEHKIYNQYVLQNEDYDYFDELNSFLEEMVY